MTIESAVRHVIPEPASPRLLRPPLDLRTIRLGGTLSHLVDAETAMAVVAERLSEGSTLPLVIASSNLDHIHHFGRGGDPAASDGRPGNHSAQEWLVLLDGTPLVWRSRMLTKERFPRLAGADLLPGILEEGQRQSAKVAFLGGTRESHELLSAALVEQFPDLRVVGYWAPTRKEIMDVQASEQLAAEIRARGVDLLIVGLGKPRQEMWISQHGSATHASVILAFGAAADFISGTAARAPGWMRSHGLEWLYRLWSEPRRLWQRYLVQGPMAFGRLLADSAELRTADKARPVGALAPAPTPLQRSGGAAQCTAVVVTFNSANEIPALLDSLAETPVTDVVMVDNQSIDGTVDVARRWAHTAADPSDSRALPLLRLIESPTNGGYAAGINLGCRAVDPGRHILVLNPDVALHPEAVEKLIAAVAQPGVGIAIPTVLGNDGAVYPSLRREPSILRALADAALGGRLSGRRVFRGEMIYDQVAYRQPADIDWATGAALLISAECAQAVGEWDEQFFLYSEETDFFRRARDAGFAARFVPDAVAVHKQGASGSSARLDALLTINRVRYFGKYHGTVATAAFRVVVGLHCMLRAHKRSSRLALIALTSTDAEADLLASLQGRP